MRNNTLDNYTIPKHKMLWPETPEVSYITIAKHIVYVIICVVALLSVFFFMLMQEANASASKAELVAIAMLSGDTLHDRQEGHAYFFSKPVIVKFDKEKK